MTTKQWHCSECHLPDLNGGIKQISKTKGGSTCYWCNKQVYVYFGYSKKDNQEDE